MDVGPVGWTVVGQTVAWIIVAWVVLSLPLGICVGAMLRQSAFGVARRNRHAFLSDKPA